MAGNERPCISVIGVTISYCRYFGAAKDLPGVRELFQQTGKFLNKATTVTEIELVVSMANFGSRSESMLSVEFRI